jgi:alcohol dehydrogenase class IV
MKPFEFYSVGRIIFGRGQSRRLGDIAASFGQRVLVIYNGQVSTAVMDSLTAAKLNVTTLRQHGEPIVAHVEAAVDQAQRASCDVVIGIGGGSAIDTAKATAGLLTNGGSPLDYMEVVGNGRKITKAAAPWIAVPTTAGTGAEATRNAVVGFPEKKFKASIRGEQLLARIALVDSELGIDVPPAMTARSGMDALCQLIESYTSNGASPMTDALGERGIPLAGQSLLRAYRHGDDLEARENMALAALWSGITLASAGLGAVHGFAAPLGANFPVPHGTVCGALLPHVIAANISALRNEGSANSAAILLRFAKVTQWLKPDGHLSDEQAIDGCAPVVAELVKSLAIEPLSRFGLTASDIPEMVALARKTSSMKFNPVVLSDEALSQVLMGAISSSTA